MQQQLKILSTLTLAGRCTFRPLPIQLTCPPSHADELKPVVAPVLSSAANSVVADFYCPILRRTQVRAGDGCHGTETKLSRLYIGLGWGGGRGKTSIRTARDAFGQGYMYVLLGGKVQVNSKI